MPACAQLCLGQVVCWGVLHLCQPLVSRTSWRQIYLLGCAMVGPAQLWWWGPCSLCLGWVQHPRVLGAGFCAPGV